MNLPQELIDKIVDGVWDIDDSPSHATTKAASLIARSWVDRSQHYIFHSIQFSTIGDQFKRWCNIVTPGPNGVSRHVRSLTIQAASTGWWINLDSLKNISPYFDSFHNVRVLRVLNWNVEWFPPEMLTRCFSPFAGGVRLLQWDPHEYMTRETWTRIVGLFPLVDYLLLHPDYYFPAGLPSGDPPGPVRKKLIVSSNHAANCLTGGSLRFREIHMKYRYDMKLETIIAVATVSASWLETLSIAKTGRAINSSNASTFASFLVGCHALRELRIDWLPVDDGPELRLIDAIPGGCIQSLRIMPSRALWEHMWIGTFNGATSLRTPHDQLAQAILRLGMRFSSRNPGGKISIWFVIPRVPYILCDHTRDSVIALWEAVEGVVSFGFQMTEAESWNINRKHSIPCLEP